MAWKTHTQTVRDIRDAVSTRPSIKLEDERRVVRLQVAGDDVFAVDASSSPTVFTYDDLAVAMRESGEWAVIDNPVTVSEAENAVDIVQKLATEVFGPRAIVEPVTISDSEDAECSPTLEVRYPAPRTEDELIAAHEQFMHRYVREVSASIRTAYSVIPIPLDADHAS